MKMNLNGISDFLKDAGKILVLAVGSEIRSDDSAGIYITDKLNEKFSGCKNLLILKGYTAPENFTGEIRQFAPSHMIIIDAADVKKDPGNIEFIDAEKITGASFSTHMLPMNVFLDYLSRDMRCKTLIIGIQPENLEFGTGLSLSVKKSADLIAGKIACCLDDIKNENKSTKSKKRA